MSYKDFSAFIKTTLTPLKNNGKVKEIYAYERENISGFPFISFAATGNQEDFHSTHNNETTYSFMIMIFDDLASKKDTKEQVEIRIMDLADQALELLRKAIVENAGGYLIIPTVGGAKYLKRQEGNTRVFEIRLDIKKKLPRR